MPRRATQVLSHLSSLCLFLSAQLWLLSHPTLSSRQSSLQIISFAYFLHPCSLHLSSHWIIPFWQHMCFNTFCLKFKPNQVKTKKSPWFPILQFLTQSNLKNSVKFLHSCVGMSSRWQLLPSFVTPFVSTPFFCPLLLHFSAGHSLNILYFSVFVAKYFWVPPTTLFIF